MSIDGDRLRIVNPDDSLTTADIRHKPSSGSSNVHAMYVQQTATSGNGQALVVESSNTTVPTLTVNAGSGGVALRLSGSLNSGGTLTFGEGASADTNLYRSAANTLKTDDALVVAGSTTLQSTLAVTSTVSFSAALTTTRSAATDVAMGTIVTNDTFDRFRILADGDMEWGPGNGSRDTNLYRSASNTLKTDDKLIAVGGIGVGNAASASTPGTVTNKIEVFDASGASLGFVAVYNAIT
jgi:hypothetical protein